MRVAILGCGQQGARHAREVSRHPQARVVAVYDQASSAAQRVAAWCQPAPQVCSSFQEAIAEADLAVVASYDSAHGGQVIHALAEGKAVFCEKPLCTSGIELAVIKRLYVESLSPGLQIHYPLRAHPLCAALQSQKAGQVYAFDATYLYGRVSKLATGWRGKDPEYSPFLGGAIHLVDLYCWLFPDQKEWEIVGAQGGQWVTAGSDYRGNDFEAAQIRWGGGRCYSHFVADFGCQHPHSHQLRVSGDQAYIEIDTGVGEARTYQRAGLCTRELAQPSEHRALFAFIDRLLTQQVRPDCPEGHVFWRATEVCLAVARQLRES